MAEEFVIKSQLIEDKINQLLPSQGGFQAGVDFSASTMVIPIVDLTETAEGSSLRQDLQTAMSHASVTSFDISTAGTTTIINTTGYFRILGTFTGTAGAASSTKDFIELFDGTTSKPVWGTRAGYGFNSAVFLNYDFNVFLEAGDSVRIVNTNASQRFVGSTRQIADISGNLTNP